MEPGSISISTFPLTKTGRKASPERFYDLRFPLIMGVLNTTPDSFTDGGKYIDLENAVERAFQMVSQGADIIDIGGESTRPFADPVTIDIEIARTIPVIERIIDNIEVPISIDTRHTLVASRALEAGASMINDVYGLRETGMDRLVADSGATAIIMHMKGTPKDMQVSPGYNDVIGDIHGFLSGRVAHMQSLGVPKDRLIVDPGIGFGKRLEDNLSILRELGRFSDIGCPVLVGASRKSFIGQLLGSGPDDRIEGSLASALIAVKNGASMVRVHDVKETKRVLDIYRAVYIGQSVPLEH
ncbi:MAG: dihydropteroate synthase [Candidatus Thermoplasmatota archaeon]|nr:dihydropteroate synthase [Candidatus Thermoplasmatota archaeon]